MGRTGWVIATVTLARSFFPGYQMFKQPVPTTIGGGYFGDGGHGS
jgi:hypothetical protein